MHARPRAVIGDAMDPSPCRLCGLLLAAALCTVSARLPAQQPATARAPSTDGTEVQQPMTAAGVVQRFTHSATGAADGFLLDDGTAVHFPAYLAAQVARLIAPNANVRVTGLMVEGTDRGATRVLEARTITDVASNRTLTVAATGENLPGSTDSSGDAGTGNGGTAGGGAGAAGGAGAGGGAGTGGAR